MAAPYEIAAPVNDCLMTLPNVRVRVRKPDRVWQRDLSPCNERA